MAQTVLPQLKEISDDLLAQEESLTTQLEEVQEKLRGVRAILPLFGEAALGEDDSDESSEQDSEPATPAKSATSTKKKAVKAEKAEKKSKSTATKAKSSAKSSAKKKDGRAASWQKYTRPGVREQSIPDAVRLVLETQPDKSFKIAEVMDALFNETMPKSQHLKARNRISNVLSGGVRNGEWFKGDRGTYRLTAD